MKQVVIIFIVLTAILSCNKSNNNQEIESKIKSVKPLAEDSDFGFNYSEFNVVHDTIKRGDTFGTILSKQNIGDRKMFEIVNSVKDTFNVRYIKPNRAYTMLRSKDKTNKLEVFVYLNYKLNLTDN